VKILTLLWNGAVIGGATLAQCARAGSSPRLAEVEGEWELADEYHEHQENEAAELLREMQRGVAARIRGEDTYDEATDAYRDPGSPVGGELLPNGKENPNFDPRPMHMPGWDVAGPSSPMQDLSPMEVEDSDEERDLQRALDLSMLPGNICGICGETEMVDESLDDEDGYM
jgi:hypothetical protein